MQALKNILVGFLVSFIGSIPLGYLNIVGFQIYEKSGMNSVIPYLIGVILIEIFVIYFTLIFAQQLADNQKLLKFIEIFSIFFMLLLAYVFYSQSDSEVSKQDYLPKYIAYSPFYIGVVLSCFNFIQIPFWTGWNLYLINSRFIVVEKKLKFLYLIGTLIGTFFGMLALILSLNLVTQHSESLSKWILSVLIPLFFIGLAIFQMFKFYKKHRVSS
jgi:threonine/homoserine/homoserine lactone efflux protein